ncbi:uncharacterized protein LOC131641756 [Vicia villosa]|uniref:uncharacterized protein LOC131641756 n=1 Tax=Vicia villosa TaxID=3911 RepID=UPI00273C4A97|nr:uncharacterized protein LOC131641756 [Vicia villosa]
MTSRKFIISTPPHTNFSCRYGDIRRAMLSNYVTHKRNKASLWWKDLCSVGSGGSGQLENWFPSAIICKLGNGEHIDFWLDRWLAGGPPLCDRFPSLYRFAEALGSKVVDNGFWISGVWEWRVNFDDFFVEEGEVKVAYELLLEGRIRGASLSADLVNALARLWKTKIPSKFLIFGWKLLLDKLPIKVNLVKRNILLASTEILCPFCGLEEEDLDHLFASCPTTSLWWTKMCDWIGLGNTFFLGNFFNRLSLLDSSCKTKFKVDTSWLFGLTFGWGVWNCRNAIVFEGVSLRDIDTLGMVKFFAWE